MARNRYLHEMHHAAASVRFAVVLAILQHQSRPVVVDPVGVHVVRRLSNLAVLVQLSQHQPSRGSSLR